MKKYITFIILILALSFVHDAKAQSNLTAMQKALEICIHKYSTLADTLAVKLSKKYGKNSNAQVCIARSYYINHDFEKAKFYLARAREFQPDNASAYLLEGDMTAFSGDSVKAAKLYEKAFHVDPKYEVAYDRYIQTVASHHPEMAVKALDILKSNLPNYPIQLKKAMLWFKAGNAIKAVEAYESADTLQMGEADFVRYAYALYMNNQYDKCVNICSLGSRHFPNSVEFDRPLFYSLTELRRYQEALPFSVKMKQHYQNVVGYKQVLRDNLYLSSAYFGLGKYDLSLGALADYLNNDSIASADDINHVRQQVNNIIHDLKNEGRYDEAGKAYLNYLHQLHTASDYDYYLWTEIYHDQLEKSIADKGDVETAYEQLDSVYKSFERDHKNWNQIYIIYYYHAAYETNLRDPQAKNGSAWPYYKEMCNTILSNANPTSGQKDMLKTAYNYAMFHAYNNGDKQEAGRYARLILNIDPMDNTARNMAKIR